MMIQGLCLCLFSAAAYGMLPVLGKLALARGMNEYQILMSRFVFGTIILFFWLLVKKPGLLRMRPRKVLQVFGLGLFLFCPQSTMFFKAIKTIPASTAVLIIYFYPALVTLLSALVFKMRLDRVVAASVLSVTLGCCLVFYDAFLRRVDPAGLAWASAALVLFCLYMILIQAVIKNENPLSVALYMFMSMALGFSLTHSPLSLLSLTSEQLFLSLGLALVPTVLSITTLYLAIEKIGSAYASIFSSFEPVATLIAAHFALGEPVVLYQLAGTGLIIIGVALPNLDLIKKKRIGGTGPAA